MSALCFTKEAGVGVKSFECYILFQCISVSQNDNSSVFRSTVKVEVNVMSKVNK